MNDTTKHNLALGLAILRIGLWRRVKKHAPRAFQVACLLVGLSLGGPDAQIVYPGGGSGGGGTVTDFSNLGSGTNTAGSFVCDTGCSIVTSGTGTNQATTFTGIANYPTLTSTSRLTNKQIVPRAVLQTVSSNAFTIDADVTDIALVPALSAGVTVNAPTATGSNPANGQELMIRFKDAASRGITWNAIFSAENGLALPTATTGDGSTYDWVKFIYNSTSSKYGLVATTFGASTSGPTTDDNVLVGNGTIAQSKALPDCDDSGGNHLNYDTTTNAFSCGTSGGGTPTFTTTKNLPITGVKLPSSNPAAIDTSETNNRLLFDAATSECVIWPFVWPSDWTSGGTLKVQYSMTSATTGGVSVDASVMAVTPGDAADINTESYDTVNNCDDATVPATAGFLDQISCTLTNKDSVAAGDYVKIQLCRAVADSSDTATGDMEVVGVELSYTH